MQSLFDAFIKFRKGGEKFDWTNQHENKMIRRFVFNGDEYEGEIYKTTMLMDDPGKNILICISIRLPVPDTLYEIKDEIKDEIKFYSDDFLNDFAEEELGEFIRKDYPNIIEFKSKTENKILRITFFQGYPEIPFESYWSLFSD